LKLFKCIFHTLITLKDHKDVEQSINQLFDIRKHQRENGGGSDINKGNQQQTPHDVKYLYGIPWEQKKKAEKHLTEKH